MSSFKSRNSVIWGSCVCLDPSCLILALTAAPRLPKPVAPSTFNAPSPWATCPLGSILALPCAGRSLMSTPPPAVLTPADTNPCLSSSKPHTSACKMVATEFLFHRGGVVRMDLEMIGRHLGTPSVETRRRTEAKESGEKK